MTAASGADREARAACLANWPDAQNGDYHPSCCRFPKSCSVPSASGADQPTLRDQLATVVDAWWRGSAGLHEHLVNALLPLIEADRERAKAEGGAEALEQAAETAYSHEWWEASGHLYARAASLRATTEEATA